MSYAKLSESEKTDFDRLLATRRALFEDIVLTRNYKRGLGMVLIVGDKPGPSAPTAPDYHHTPFYSTKHCSGWLNSELLKAGVPEDRLVWINSADKDGIPTDYLIIDKIDPSIVVCLGGNAEKWVNKIPEHGGEYHAYHKFDHPQYHKRFKNKQPYPLIGFLHDAILGSDDSDYF